MLTVVIGIEVVQCLSKVDSISGHFQKMCTSEVIKYKKQVILCCVYYIGSTNRNSRISHTED